MKKTFFSILLTIILTSSVIADGADLAVLQSQEEPVGDGQYRVSIFIQGVSSYPYTRRNDPINRLLGRRGAIVYAYKRLTNLIKRDLQDFVNEKKILLTKQGYIYSARVVTTRYLEDVAEIILELPLVLDRQNYEKINEIFEEKYLLEMVTDVSGKYDKRIEPIGMKYWAEKIQMLDERYVDKDVYDAIE